MMWICFPRDWVATSSAKKATNSSDVLAGGGVTQDAAALDVQRRVEGKRSMPEVLEPVPLQPARRQGQNRVESIQRLDRRLLVQAEHRGMLGRVDVEAIDVASLLFEGGIVGSHVAFHSLRLQTRPSPSPSDQHVVDSKLLGQTPGAPVRRSIGGLLLRPR